MKSLDRLIRAFRRLPGVGPRQAERFSAYFLRASQGETEEFIAALLALKEEVKLCPVCIARGKSAKSAPIWTASKILFAWWKTRKILNP